MNRSTLSASALLAALLLSGCSGDAELSATPSPSASSPSTSPSAAESPIATAAGLPGPLPDAPGGFVRVTNQCFSFAVPTEAAAALEGADDCAPRVVYGAGSFSVSDATPSGGAAVDLDALAASEALSGETLKGTVKKEFGGAPGAVLTLTTPGGGAERSVVLIDVTAEQLTYQGRPITALVARGSSTPGLPPEQQVLLASLGSISFDAAPASAAPAAGGAGSVSTQCFTAVLPRQLAAQLAGARACDFSVSDDEGSFSLTSTTAPMSVAEAKAAMAAKPGEKPYEVEDLVLDGVPAVLFGIDPATDAADSGERRYDVQIDVSKLGLVDGGRPVASLNLLSSAPGTDVRAFLKSLTWVRA